MKEERKIEEILKRLNGEKSAPEKRRADLEQLKNSPEGRSGLIERNPSAIFSLLFLQKKEEHFWKGLWPGIYGAISAPSPWRKLVFSFTRSYKPALAACMLFIFLMIGFYFLHDGRQSADLKEVSDILFIPTETDTFSDLPLMENIEPTNAVILDMGIIDGDEKTHLYHLTHVDIEL